MFAGASLDENSGAFCELKANFFRLILTKADVITMAAGCRHTVIAETELKLIEVQLGEDINVHDKQKFELEY